MAFLLAVAACLALRGKRNNRAAPKDPSQPYCAGRRLGRRGPTLSSIQPLQKRGWNVMGFSPQEEQKGPGMGKNGSKSGCLAEIWDNNFFSLFYYIILYLFLHYFIYLQLFWVI